MSQHGLAGRIRAVLELDPTAPAVEFDGRWRTWGDLARTADDLEDALDQLSLRPSAEVGVLLRNEPAAVALLLGVLRADACVVALNPNLGADRVRADLDRLELALVAGSAFDVEQSMPDGARTAATLSVRDVGGPPDLVVPPACGRNHGSDDRGVAVRILTSGTTGPPKRIDLTYDTLERVMEGAKHYEGNRRSEVALRQGVVIVTAPLAHVSGLFRVLQAVLDGRQIALLDRFTVEGWADAVRRHRPKTVSLVPTAVRMVLESDLEPEVFESVRSVVSGTAPLDPEVADAFTERFGVPVLTSYGATEFGGGVAGWN